MPRRLGRLGGKIFFRGRGTCYLAGSYELVLVVNASSSCGVSICTEELAFSEALYILIRMLQCRESVLPADNEPWSEKLSTTLIASSVYKVSLRREQV